MADDRFTVGLVNVMNAKIDPSVLKMLMATLCFSLMQVTVKSLSHIPAIQLVFFRGIVSLIITFFMVRRKALPFLGTHRTLLFWRGLTGTFALGLFFYTLQKLPLTTAVTLHYLAPIFTIIFAALLGEERITKKHWLCFGLALIGVVVIKGFTFTTDLTSVFCGILSAAFAGIAYNIVHRLKGREDPLIVVFYFPLLVVPIAGPLSIPTWVGPVSYDWVKIILLGLLTQIAQILLTQSYQGNKVGKVAIVNYFGPFLAIIWGSLFFNEEVSLKAFLGIGIILFAVVYLNHKDR